MNTVATDTIVAPITASGQAAVQLVRISGPRCRELLSKLLPNAEPIISQPQRLSKVKILDLCSSTQTTPLDYGLAAFFPGPHSFTGEDVCELHLHGSPYLMNRLLEGLERHGVRLARAGEFSERAYLNGRMDLTQAEAVADIIAAETEAQARIAREQLGGRISQAITALGEPLRDLLAEIEALIDFPEEDILPLTYEQWAAAVAPIHLSIDKLLASFSVGKLHREGATLVLAGVPNAGKSSLLNCFVGEDRAIVTAKAGTTRDALEVGMQIAGIAIRAWDTAGLADEETREIEEVERLGIARSWKKIAEADVVLFVFDALAELEPQLRYFHSVKDKARACIQLLNKVDALEEVEQAVLADQLEERIGAPILSISASSGVGIPDVFRRVETHFKNQDLPKGSLLVSNRRHFECLAAAKEALVRTLEALKRREPAEIIALEVRVGLGNLSDLVGATPNEDILGRIFSKFCIGK